MKHDNLYSDYKSGRILYLYTTLINGGSINKAEEAERFGVHLRSIQRDIDDLRAFFENQFAAGRTEKKLVYDKKLNRYYLCCKDDSSLSNSEILAVCKILLESRSMCKKDMESIINKLLDSCVPQENQAIVKSLIANELLLYIEPQHKKQFTDDLWDIGVAVKERKMLKIKYQKQDSSTVERLVKPVGIMFSEFYFYLTAFIEGIDKKAEFQNKEITDTVSPLVSEQTIGISEAFNIRIDEYYGEGDYLYYFGGIDDIWLGLWGIIRAHNRRQKHLLPLCKNEFEKLLSYAVSLSNGVISENVLDSGEIVTEFTIAAERQTEKFTGIHINSNITQRELRLRAWDSGDITYKFCRVKALNRAVQKQLNGLIALKEEVLSKVLNCQMFTMNYPLLIEHIIREAKLYRKYLHALESDGEINIQSMKDIECFWNQIMMEHALFIRGLLDPSEVDLISSANTFAEDYAVLLKSCHNAQNNSASANSLTETQKFKDFKIAGVKGIEACKIRSIILPLLADHVLREANHFIRILKN